jgi:hypothetical protein
MHDLQGDDVAEPDRRLPAADSSRSPVESPYHSRTRSTNRVFAVEIGRDAADRWPVAMRPTGDGQFGTCESTPVRHSRERSRSRQAAGSSGDAE